MSKLSKNIEARQTGNRKAVLEPMKLVTFTEHVEAPTLNSAVIYQYRIDATLGAAGYARNSEELQRLKENVRKLLVEEIFGEFRKPLYELQAAIYDRDFDGAEKIASSIYTSMFLE